MKSATAIAALAVYAAVYAASAYWLNLHGAFPLEEALMLLVTLGIGFSFLSWVTTIGIKPPVAPIARPSTEALVMLVLAAAIAAWLVWGKTWADNIIPDAAHGGSRRTAALGDQNGLGESLDR